MKMVGEGCGEAKYGVLNVGGPRILHMRFVIEERIHILLKFGDYAGSLRNPLPVPACVFTGEPT